jgi:hypothetical protein
MELSNYNFGITGQPTNEWDNFLCFGRKCKQRKAERHKVRMEKRKLKNDQQRAETEALRAETGLTKQLASPAPTPQMAPQMMMQQTPQPTATSQAPAPQVQKAGMGSPVMIVIGLLVVGGLVYQSMKKKGAAAPVQTA